MFFSTGTQQKSVLADLEPDLVDAYRAVQDHAEEVIQALDQWPSTPETYYEIRASPRPESLVERGARFIYLNAHCWNGVYRVNKKGQFNVPFAGRSGSEADLARKIRGASLALKGADIQAGDFAQTLATAKACDLVYLDPPYVTGHTDNGFLEYNERVFSWNDQLRLAKTAAELADGGVHVVATNADHETIRELYRGFAVSEIERYSSVASSTLHRRVVKELLITSVRHDGDAPCDS